MGGNNEADDDDFEDELDEEIGDEQVDVDRAIKDLDSARRRGQRGAEPAWRKLEQRAEQKHTAELISDFEDYDIGEPEQPAKAGKRGGHGRPRH